MYSKREFSEAGGLTSYATGQTAAYVQAGFYAGRILKGEKPVDLRLFSPPSLSSLPTRSDLKCTRHSR
jgi:ABC-type uncharacterized transport system substrate-binding protein